MARSSDTATTYENYSCKSRQELGETNDEHENKNRPGAGARSRGQICSLVCSSFDHRPGRTLFTSIAAEETPREGRRARARMVREDWIFTDAHSGKLESRPAFDRLKTLVRTGAPDTVYVFDVSRVRTQDDGCIEAGRRVQEARRASSDFVETLYEDTAAGRLGFTTMAAVAEFLGEKIIEDSKRGSLEKLEQGKLTHGSAPYGYTLHRQTPAGRLQAGHQ